MISHWIDEQIALCQPANVHLCDGSPAEFDRLAAELVSAGTFIPLTKRPHSFLARTDPDDVARVEESTFICSPTREEAGPTNNWEDPTRMRAHLNELFRGCMQGRTMYVIPYCMGPIGSPYARWGVELTDSAYVVLNMHLMTRIAPIPNDAPVVPGLHSVGMPGKMGPWICDPKNRKIVHFTREREIYSYGSGYGGNSLLGKKCFALRIGSTIGRDEGWLAEHMMILGITSPEGKKRYIAGAFPSACGKTNLAMLNMPIPGWKVECVGDDIAWIHRADDGTFWAINPEAGYFGVAPGTSYASNERAMQTIEHDALFTNVAQTPDGDVWWEGIGEPPPPGLISWKGTYAAPFAHPNSRFTVRARQNPIWDPASENPQGVPLSAILFGGRRSSLMPLVVEARTWTQGVFFGSTMASETTAAAKGEVGVLRRDPFAMRPFCGYNMGDYFAHWLKMEGTPRIYAVNWFQKGETGEYLWPGFSANGYVLKWIFERCEGTGDMRESPIGNLPRSIEGAQERLFQVDRQAWLKECDDIERHFALFGGSLPPALDRERAQLRARLIS